MSQQLTFQFSVWLPCVYVCVFLSLSLYMSVCLSVCLFVYLSEYVCRSTSRVQWRRSRYCC